MKLSNPSVRVVEDGVEYLVRTPQQVEEDLRKLSQIRKDEDFLEHWRRILSYKEPICPKCGEIGSVLRKNSKGKVLGCDRCLVIRGYCEEAIN